MENEMKEIRESRKSWVRIWVTYAAAAYVFGVSAMLIIAFLWFEEIKKDDLAAAKDIFMMVLPVATGVITYWFASRKPGESEPKEPKQPSQ